MFGSVVQTPVVSLFSSTNSDPLGLWASFFDEALPADSFIHLLHDHHSAPSPGSPKTLLKLPVNLGQQGDSQDRGYELNQTVVHIQSPTVPKTYIQCPPSLPGDLGIKHPWIHLQVRNIGREWSFEVAIVDHAGRIGIIRLSTFQVTKSFSFNDSSVDTNS